jgi:hypothetical protein
MSFFSRVGSAFKSFFSNPEVEAVEKEVVSAGAPLAETALSAVAASNPIAEIVISAVVNPVITAEAKKL